MFRNTYAPRGPEEVKVKKIPLQEVLTMQSVCEPVTTSADAEVSLKDHHLRLHMGRKKSTVSLIIGVTVAMYSIISDNSIRASRPREVTLYR